jgi:hypothetical protein
VKVLLVAEGLHEHGGALEKLVRRLANPPPNVEFISMKVSDPVIRTHLLRGKGPRLTKRALRWINYAESEHCDAIVILVDEDGDPRRRAHLDLAQDETGLRLRRALGVAVRTFDAWILADERALSMALGRTIDRQKNPEDIKDPKSAFRDLLDAEYVDSRPRDVYAAVMETVDIDLLAERCPRGFAPFASRVRSLGAK